jgi:hypothetical protein
MFQKFMDEFVTEYPIPDTLVASFPHVRKLQRYHPGLKNFLRKGILGLDSTFYTSGHLISWKEDPDRPGVGEGQIQYEDGTVATKDVYVKTIHLLEPFAYLGGDYNEKKMELPANVDDIPISRAEKLLDPNNQAYIDVTTMSILGRLNETGITPHSMKIYGAVCGIYDKYMYDITDEYDDLKKEEWFWRAVGLSGECVRIIPDKGVTLDDKTIDEIRRCPIKISAEKAVEAAIELPVIEVEAETVAVTITDEVMEEVTFAPAEEDDDVICLDGAEAAADAATIPELTYRIMIECKDMPVILLFEEVATDTIDTLLEDDADIEDSLLEDEDSSTDDALALMQAEKDERWSAWMMQVICSLIQFQALLGLCHNDLHTNNIVWTETAAEFIVYKSLDGKHIWKVPTYGKMFHVIDFGRATFRIGKKEFMSDDFFSYGDAAGQYNYGPCYNSELDLLPSNPSFDLCRLVVSMLDSLYVETPKVRGGKKKRRIMSNEEGMKKYYTVSDLYNRMWSWLIDDAGNNVLRDAADVDKYPGFDLYVHIAAYVHGADPKDQIRQAPFKGYEISADEYKALKKDSYVGTCLYINVDN